MHYVCFRVACAIGRDVWRVINDPWALTLWTYVQLREQEKIEQQQAEGVRIGQMYQTATAVGAAIGAAFNADEPTMMMDKQRDQYEASLRGDHYDTSLRGHALSGPAQPSDTTLARWRAEWDENERLNADFSAVEKAAPFVAGNPRAVEPSQA